MQVFYAFRNVIANMDFPGWAQNFIQRVCFVFDPHDILSTLLASSNQQIKVIHLLSESDFVHFEQVVADAKKQVSDELSILVPQFNQKFIDNVCDALEMTPPGVMLNVFFVAHQMNTEDLQIQPGVFYTDLSMKPLEAAKMLLRLVGQQRQQTDTRQTSSKALNLKRELSSVKSSIHEVVDDLTPQSVPDCSHIMNLTEKLKTINDNIKEELRQDKERACISLDNGIPGEWLIPCSILCAGVTVSESQNRPHNSISTLSKIVTEGDTENNLIKFYYFVALQLPLSSICLLRLLICLYFSFLGQIMKKDEMDEALAIFAECFNYSPWVPSTYRDDCRLQKLFARIKEVSVGKVAILWEQRQDVLTEIYDETLKRKGKTPPYLSEVQLPGTTPWERLLLSLCMFPDRASMIVDHFIRDPQFSPLSSLFQLPLETIDLHEIVELLPSTTVKAPPILFYGLDKYEENGAGHNQWIPAEDPVLEIVELSEQVGLTPSKLKVFPVTENMDADDVESTMTAATIRGHWLVLTNAELNMGVVRQVCKLLSTEDRVHE